jgi:hypothetical protein
MTFEDYFARKELDKSKPSVQVYAATSPSEKDVSKAAEQPKKKIMMNFNGQNLHQILLSKS